MKVRSINHGVLTTELYFPGDNEETIREGDSVFQSRHHKSDLIVNVTDNKEHMLEGVPELDRAKYCRRDIFLP